MVLEKRHLGRAFLAGAAWVLVVAPLLAQQPLPPGFSPVDSTFGATGYGSPGMFRPHRLSLGMSGGGGGQDGSEPYRFGQQENLLGKSLLAEDPAHLLVLLPAKDAKLWVNDTLTKKQGMKRRFMSPLLMPDAHYVYDLKVRWKDSKGHVVEQSRSVMVRAGSQALVDFTLREGSR
jgi:uncharacterized protein (TIGR03000 family)